MTSSRIIDRAVRMLAFLTFSAALASTAAAQRGTPPAGPPETTKGAAKSAAKADKGQANAEAKRAEAREDKALRTAEKVRDDSSDAAIKRAHGEEKTLLKGVTLTKAERDSVKAIEQRYDDAVKDLRKQERAAAQAGQTRFAIVSKLDALRERERAELRGRLSPAAQAKLDQNLAALRASKP